MSRKMKVVLIALSLAFIALVLSACSQPQPQESSADLIASDSTVASSTVSVSGFTLDDAKECFASAHPNAEIVVAKLEGDAYYVEG